MVKGWSIFGGDFRVLEMTDLNFTSRLSLYLPLKCRLKDVVLHNIFHLLLACFVLLKVFFNRISLLIAISEEKCIEVNTREY